MHEKQITNGHYFSSLPHFSRYFITNYISDLNAIDPRKRHLYAVVISDRDLSLQEPQCITCNESPDCQYVSASFSYSGQYYILECLGPGIPFYKLRSTIDDRGWFILLTPAYNYLALYTEYPFRIVYDSNVIIFYITIIFETLVKLNKTTTT